MTRTQPDVGYRHVILSQTPARSKLAALAKMQRPSSNLLTTIIRDPDSHPKLKLLASDRLATLVKQREIAKALNL